MMCCVLCCGEVVASAIVWNKGPVMTIPYVWIHDQELVAPYLRSKLVSGPRRSSKKQFEIGTSAAIGIKTGGING